MTERLTLREEFEAWWLGELGQKMGAVMPPHDAAIEASYFIYRTATERAARICEAELPGDEWAPCSAYDEGRYVEAKYLAAEIRGGKNEP